MERHVGKFVSSSWVFLAQLLKITKQCVRFYSVMTAHTYTNGKSRLTWRMWLYNPSILAIRMTIRTFNNVRLTAQLIP